MWIAIGLAIVVVLIVGKVAFFPRRGGIDDRIREVRRDTRAQSNTYYRR